MLTTIEYISFFVGILFVGIIVGYAVRLLGGYKKKKYLRGIIEKKYKEAEKEGEMINKEVVKKVNDAKIMPENKLFSVSRFKRDSEFRVQGDQRLGTILNTPSAGIVKKPEKCRWSSLGYHAKNIL